MHWFAASRPRCDKWSYRGGRGGLFVPDGTATNLHRLFICEGPSDAAALLSIGLPAVGRTRCQGAMPATFIFVRRIGAHDVAIVADHDEAGRNGSNRLVRLLVTVGNVSQQATTSAATTVGWADQSFDR